MRSVVLRRMILLVTVAGLVAGCGSSKQSTSASTSTSTSPSTTATIVTTAAPATTTAPGPPTPGADGVGDRLLPQAGNGGYDVSAYDLTMAWDPATNRLDATARITAVTTQDLSVFDLDLRGFDVSSANVNGAPAEVSRDGQELKVTVPTVVASGDALDITIAYGGVPEPVVDPDGSSEGWMTTADGIVALGEPQGSPGWFPVNDHPSDKATFSLSMTVPSDLRVVSNGVPTPPVVDGDRTTFAWTESAPMAPYLATVAIGHFTVTTTATTSGLPVITAVGPGLEDASAPTLARIPEMIDWLSEQFGPYPFDSTGAIVVDAPEVGYDLETQDRPTFTHAPDDATMVHELAHQWFGDSVSASAWDEIWLNEGFAGYVEWLWMEHDGGSPATQTFTDTVDGFAADDPFWQSPPGPEVLADAASLFGEPVYTRGAMTLGALRGEVGDASFFEILRTWATDHRDGNVTTQEFIELAERVSGQSLTDLFAAWLTTPSRPVD